MCAVIGADAPANKHVSPPISTRASLQPQQSQCLFPQPPSCPQLRKFRITLPLFRPKTKQATMLASSTRRRVCQGRNLSFFLTRVLQLSKYPALNHLEERTQVPKTYAVIGGVVLLIFLHTFNSFAAPVSNLVGWGLPAYLSFKAIETPTPHDDVQWLTYWVVFGYFNFLESFAIRLVLHYVPWYYALKSIFVVWLQLPAFRVRHLYFLFPHLAHSSDRVRKSLISM